MIENKFELFNLKEFIQFVVYTVCTHDIYTRVQWLFTDSTFVPCM